MLNNQVMKNSLIKKNLKLSNALTLAFLIILPATLTLAEHHGEKSAVSKVATTTKASSPKATVSTVIEEARAMVSKPGMDTSSESFRADFKKVLFSIFDFKDMARRSLGKNWKDATPEEQTEFVDLFSKLLSKTYLNRVINGFPNSTINYGEEKVKGKRASLKTKITSDSEDVAVNYRLQNKNGEWRIYDIVIENISLVANYRSEFSGIIRKEKMAGLIAQLKKKVEKGEAEKK